MTELWKPIKGYKGFYEVSNRGRVRSVPRIIKYIRNGKEATRLQKGTIRIPGKVGKLGHLGIVLSKNGKLKNYWLHRLVAEAFISNPNCLPVVMHLDDDPANNRKRNLRWGTYQNNIDDMYAKGRASVGEERPASVLVTKDIPKIRLLLAKGVSQRKIATHYEVSQGVINKINTGKAWTHA